MTTPELLTFFREKYIKYESKLYPVAAVVFLVIGTVLILVGIFSSKLQPVQAKAVESFSKTVESLALPSEGKTDTITVDIAGAVLKPGVYTLSSSDRLLAAIETAGGFDSKVHKGYVARSLNLSQQLTDQQKIYIPFQNEKIESLSFQSTTSQPTTNTPSQFVNVNTSSLAELETLTGVGAVRAQNVISGRPFKSLQELVQKGILTQKILNDNKDKIKI